MKKLFIIFFIIISLPSFGNEYKDTITREIKFNGPLNFQELNKINNDAKQFTNQLHNKSNIYNSTLLSQKINNSSYYNALGMKNLRDGNYNDALNNFNKAIELGLNNEQVYFNIALAKAGQKDYTGAIEYCNKAIAINPNSDAKKLLNVIGQEYTNLAHNKFEQKDYANAIKYYTKAISINKNNSNLYNSRGNAKYNIKDYQGAISDYTNSIKLNPNYLNSYINRAWAYFELKNYDKSIEDFNSAIKISPKNSDLYFNRGIVKNNKGDYHSAISDYSTVIQLDPKHWRSYLYRGDNYYQIKKYFSALKDYQNSLKVQNTKEATSKIISLRQNFKNPQFLIKNGKYILEDLGYMPCLILLICIIVLLINTNKTQVNFKEYTQEEIYNTCKFDQLNIHTPTPKPEDFHLDKDRIDYLEQMYQTKNTSFFNIDEESGNAILWSLLLSYIFFMDFMDKIFKMYFDNLKVDWLWAVEIVIPTAIIYFAIRKLSSCFTMAPDITPYESKTYLLYKGALELYHEKMVPIKKSEEKRLRKIREAEEKKLKQQHSYWVKYWSEKQQNGFDFENAVGELYRKLGYKVNVTKGTGDGGVDLILKKDTQITIVQCKAHQHQVGPNDVRALWGVREDFNADRAIFVAYSGVTQGAWDFVRGKKLRIVDVNELIRLSIQVHSEV